MVIRLGGSVFVFLSLWNSDSCFRLGRGGGGREGDRRQTEALLEPGGGGGVLWMDGWMDR